MHSSSSTIEHEQHDEQQQQQEGHLLTPWKSADQPPVKKKSSFRRLSFFKPSSSSNSSTTPSTPTLLTSPVLTTNTINKEYDPETGNKVINNFMIIKEIGRGMHGKVKLAQDLDTGELVAIKIVDKASRKRQLGYSILRENNNNKENNSSTFLEESEQKIRREIAILKKCAHPHVVKLREVIDDPLSRKIYLALEYMQGGEIIWRNEDEDTPVMTHSEAKSIFRDVISGLDYLHYQGIIHRDIKPANLLLTKEKIVKISDFGVSYFSQHLAKGGVEYNDEIDRELAETVGTPAFFAPELCCCTSSDQHSTHITKAIDVWALGVTLYCFIFGQCPFTASTEFELFDIIPTQPLTFPTDIPSSLQDLLERLLTKDSQERITLQEVKQHPWVIEDVQDVDAWLKESDPTLYQTVQVTDEDVSHAVTTIMDKLKRSIHRISSSLFHSFNNERKHSRSKSNTSFVTTPSSSSDIIINSSSSPISHSQYHHQQHPHHLYEEEDDDDYEFDHEEQEREERKGGGQWIPKSFTNMTLLSSSSSSSSSDLKGAATAQDQQQQQQIPSSKYPFQIDRNGSSGSSMSGLVVSFNNNAGSNKK